MGKDYCQITIQRDELLKLIYTNTLQDAAMNLADCLQQAYTEPLKMEINYPGINIDAKERKIRKSIEFRSELNNFTNIMKQLEIFEKWYNANKILLVSNKKIRTEKIDVNIRLAGLKGYDLNEGIPDGQGRRIKDGVNELVRQMAVYNFHKISVTLRLTVTVKQFNTLLRMRSTRC